MSRYVSWLLMGLALAALLAMPVTDVAAKGRLRAARCPGDMVSIRGRYCIDRYEAYTAVMLSRGRLQRHSPFKSVENKKVKALNARGRVPQAYISRQQAAAACENAGKRLCSDDEWVTACKGKKPTAYPYGEDHKPGRCNDRGISSFNKYFGLDGKEAPKSSYTWENLNDPRLNQAKGTIAKSGRFRGCKNSFHVYDMVGNVHEWTGAPGGTFRGGYFLDVHKHGNGCDYKTTAHNTKYHDYSTGFRCCKTPGAKRAKKTGVHKGRAAKSKPSESGSKRTKKKRAKAATKQTKKRAKAPTKRKKKSGAAKKRRGKKKSGPKRP